MNAARLVATFPSRVVESATGGGGGRGPQTDGTDGNGGNGGGGTTEYFLELFTTLSDAAGVQVPATLLEACASAVDEYVEDMAEFMDDEDAYRRKWLRELGASRPKPRLTVVSSSETRG
jgi:hypothetical protein